MKIIVENTFHTLSYKVHVLRVDLCTILTDAHVCMSERERDLYTDLWREEENELAHRIMCVLAPVI